MTIEINRLAARASSRRFRVDAGKTSSPTFSLMGDSQSTP